MSQAEERKVRMQRKIVIGITIEPIMDFDVKELVSMVKCCRPSFVNIGADSKGHHLPEPPTAKIVELIQDLQLAGIKVNLKPNLERLMK